MIKLLQKLFGLEDEISDIPEYEIYKKLYPQVKLFEKQGVYYIEDLNRTRPPTFFPVSRFVFSDTKRYSREANAKVHFIKYCKDAYEVSIKQRYI